MGGSTSLWRVLLDPRAGRLSAAEAEALRPAMMRLAQLTSPATAAGLLAPGLPEGFAALPADAITRDRLYTRYLRVETGRWLRMLADAGIPVVTLKGFATGLAYYPAPEDRGLGDVDLLVRRIDIGRLVARLRADGFRFRKAQGTPAWGLASDASFHPLVAPDGRLAFDLHVHPDDYPVHRALTTEAVFASANAVEQAGARIAVPSDAHLFLLALTNAARDKYDPHAVKCLVDAAVRLSRVERELDWSAVRAIARAGGYESTVRLAALVLHHLGVPAARLPRDLLQPFRGVAAWEFRRVAAGLENLFAAMPSKLVLQRREWLLTATPRTVLFRNWRRLRGLVRPWPGTPAT